MRIVHGLLAGQVLQRDGDGMGNAKISGTCRMDGDVEIHILDGDKVLPGHDWRLAGRAAERTFEATLAGLPAGGPYGVELRIASDSDTPESLRVEEIFVGDVWILAGQSNMEGVGNLKDAPEPHPLVRAFYMRDEWGLARGKIHFLSEAVDVVHNGYGAGNGRPSDEELDTIRRHAVKGVGPGLAFGLDMQRRTGIPQGLIACAHGGTSMAQWSPALRDRGGASLYGAMMRRYEKLGQPVAGILWYQGESDANEECAEVYTEKMVELVAATRADMGLPELPWMIVQLGCHAAPGGYYWNSIQEQQRRLPEIIPHLDGVPAIDLALDDGIHISGEDQTVLGRRLARIADRLAHRNPQSPPAIALRKMATLPTPDTNKGCPWMAVKLTYDHVVGGLVSEGRPTGYSLVDNRGGQVPGIFRITLAGEDVILHTDKCRFQLASLGVSYGYGRHPYCNIADGDGMSIPAMQAVKINPDCPHVCRDWETARLTEARTLADVDAARLPEVADWQPAPPRTDFGFLPKSPDDPSFGVFAMRTRVTAAENVPARLIFGANAPFKIWLNDAPVIADAKASPPLNPEQYKADMQIPMGENRLTIAIDLPGPAAFLGINACIGTPEETREPRLSL